MTVTRRIRATPERVWEVLADGWLYPLWVVGATRMRAVDEQWPAVIDDTTEVLEVTPCRMLRLRARAWPAGEAEVVMTLTAENGETLVEIAEDAVSGPGTLVPGPLRRPMIHVRNVEAMGRLAAIAEGRYVSGLRRRRRRRRSQRPGRRQPPPRRRLVGAGPRSPTGRGRGGAQ